MSGPASEEVKAAAKDFVTFLNKAVTPFHAVEELAARLKGKGFMELNETESWKVEPNTKYYVTRNRSAIFAFAVGGKFVPGNGFTMMAAHTDSPSLRVKPVSKISCEDYLQVGVSTYGGGIWRTWFDRDLSIAGLVVYKKDNSLTRALINIARPVMYIPNLAIHFVSSGQKNEINFEKELRPILATLAASKLNGQNKAAFYDDKDEALSSSSNILEEHHTELLNLIAEEIGCDSQNILDFDLYLYDNQPAAIGGLHEEFISGQRLDNLVGAFTTIGGLLESLETGNLAEDEHIRFAACYDNEECGSKSAQGAESAITEWILRRLSVNGSKAAFEEAISSSFLLSVDNAHAVHPNYSDKHEQNHKPAFHGGVVVKINVNQKYATSSVTHSIIKHIASIAGEPLQKVVVRNDSRCGTTVGPILSSNLGLQTADVGCAQLAMHSIRELTCTSSIYHAIKLYSTYFNHLPSVMKSLR